MKQRPKTLSEKFHTQTRETYERYIRIPQDPTMWPKSWVDIHCKEYPRVNTTELPNPEHLHTTLTEALSKRSSAPLLGQEKIALENVSTLLHYSSGIKEEMKKSANSYSIKSMRHTRRHYPSGGARYPIETYVVIQHVSGIPKGIYHYNVKKHALEQLKEGKRAVQQFQKALTYEEMYRASFFFVYSIVWSRMLPKYHDLGYRLALMETGHLSQNALLIATALNLQTRPCTGFSNAQVEELLTLDPEQEATTYVLAFGKDASLE